jgi:hypothetical protein
MPARLVAEARARAPTFSYLYAQEDPDDALSRLRVETYKSGGGPLLHLHYLADGLPIVIDRFTDAEEVSGCVREYLEECFRGRRGRGATLVRQHLAAVVEIVNFCLKQRHADGMGTPLTYAAAAWLCEVGEGLVRADEQGWLRPGDGGELVRLAAE